MKTLKAIRQLVRDTLHQFVRFFHIGFRVWIVWGIGVAFSKSGGWEIDSDYKWMAMLIQWKLYLGPLIVVGNIPYRFKRCHYKPNTPDEGRAASARTSQSAGSAGGAL